MKLLYDSWGNLPVAKYQKIKEIIRSGGDYTDVEILSILCGCPVDDILNMPICDMMTLKQGAMFLTRPVKVKDRLSFNSIKIEGQKYDLHTDMRKVSTAQFIDFQTFYQDYEKNYCNVLACFIIPEGHRYGEGYDALELAEYLGEKLDVETAENVCFFFAKRTERSYRKELMSLIFQTMKMWIKTRDPRMGTALKELVRQREHITGLGRLMRLPTQS